MAAVAYEPDCVVIDVGEPELDPEGLKMQARANSSAWHRRAIGGLVTACGVPLDFQQSVRHESYLGELCRDGCFAPYELAISERLNDEARKLEDQ